MGDPAELTRLLRLLKTTASPVARAKLLARAWRSLRRLDARELRALAAGAGLERAEELLERFSRGHGRLSSRVVGELLRNVREVEPSEVGEWLAASGDPEERPEQPAAGLDAVEPGTLEVDRPTPPEPQPQPRLKTAPASSFRPAPVVRAAAVPAAALAASRPAADAPTGEIAPPERPSAADGRELLGQLESAPTVLRRLRLLDREMDRARGLDTDELSRLLELFPDGWARRRALCALLRARIPDSLMRAVYLIERLDSAVAQRWCVATLLDGWTLEPHERAALAERLTPFRPTGSAATGLPPGPAP